MPMLPPLVRDLPPDDAQSSTGRPVSARMVRPQRRYASNFNISFVYEPPRPITGPGFPTPESTFDKWCTAAAELGLSGGGAGGPPDPAARGQAAASGVAAAPRRMLHDALLGTTAVVLLGVLGGIGYLVWSGTVPGATAPGGTASKGSGIAAWVQPVADFAAKAVARAVPDPAPPAPPGKDVAADTPAPRPALQPMAPPPLPVVPDRLALTAPTADKPALAVPPPPASSPPAVAAEAVPAPERAAGPAALAKPSAPDPAAPAPAIPPAVAADGPAPEPAAMVAVPPAKPAEADATPPAAVVADRVAPTVEQAMAQAVPPAKPSAPDAAAPVPSIAAVTIRLLPAPGWTAAAASELASLPEAAAPPTEPAALSAATADPMLPAEPAAVPAEMAKVVPPGVDAQQVVSTMELVQQMSLLVHDMHGESLRYRTEVTALTGAVQAKASSLEGRLKLAEARSAAAGSGGSDLAGDGDGLRAAGLPSVLRGYRVQAGSPGAAVLTDMGAGPERAARLLVMVGDQLPGAGRVTAIVQRGRAWIVRTERGVIQ